MATKTDLARFRALLVQRRAELEAEGNIALVPENAGDETARKVDEDAAPLAEMNQVIASRRNLERSKQLEAIGDALARIDEDPDDFGTCEDCSEPIGKRRLELIPWVTLCVRCQERLERGHASRARRKHLTDYS